MQKVEIVAGEGEIVVFWGAEVALAGVLDWGDPGWIGPWFGVQTPCRQEHLYCYCDGWGRRRAAPPVHRAKQPGIGHPEFSM